MTAIVDASFLLAPFNGRRQASRLLQILHEEHRVSAPALLCWETANALRRMAKNDDVAEKEESDHLRALLSNIDLVPPGRAGMERTVEIAQELRLSIYDAAYLQLAESMANSVLATYDRRLREAATRLIGPSRLLPVTLN